MIPRTIHRIWLGDDPMPEEFVEYGETWRRHHPDWEMRLWTEEDLEGIEGRELVDRGRYQAERADVLRYLLLLRMGGVYVDTDFECLRSIEPLIDGVDAFSAWFSDWRTNTAIMGFSPGHPAMGRIVREVGPRVGTGDDQKLATGPLFVDSVLKEFPDVVLFPRELFYSKPSSPAPGAYALHHSSRTWKTHRELREEIARKQDKVERLKDHISEMEATRTWRLGMTLTRIARALRLVRPDAETPAEEMGEGTQRGPTGHRFPGPEREGSSR